MQNFGLSFVAQSEAEITKSDVNDFYCLLIFNQNLINCQIKYALKLSQNLIFGRAIEGKHRQLNIGLL